MQAAVGEIEHVVLEVYRVSDLEEWFVIMASGFV